jgi:hypothetical protein
MKNFSNNASLVSCMLLGYLMNGVFSRIIRVGGNTSSSDSSDSDNSALALKITAIIFASLAASGLLACLCWRCYECFSERNSSDQNPESFMLQTRNDQRISSSEDPVLPNAMLLLHILHIQNRESVPPQSVPLQNRAYQHNFYPVPPNTALLPQNQNHRNVPPQNLWGRLRSFLIPQVITQSSRDNTQSNAPGI